MFSRVDTKLPASNVQSMAVGDLDGDGHMDLVVAHGPVSGDRDPRPTVSALLSQGNGTFVTRFTPFGDRTARRVLLEDLDGDGRVDLVVLGRDADGLGPVQVYLGQGNGTFDGRVDVALVSPGGIAVGDLDGDGKPDLIMSDADGNRLLLAFGQGDGTFERQAAHEGLRGREIALGDVDGDGQLDVLVLGAEVHVLLNRGGVLREATPVAVSPSASAMKLADLNDDGVLDLVVVEPDENALTVFPGLGQGRFGSAQRLSVGAGPRDVAMADVDGDGHLDLISADREADEISVLLGRGDCTFEDRRAFAVGAQPAHVVAADVTGDEKMDIVTANASGSVTVLINALQ
ncbi:FG-GAP repeat domain-containing protein [Chondromyces crocatus]|nr:VCBS repeat-containing protein [Chondromyces crocatus]